MAPTENELAAAVAGDEHANDEYGVTSAVAAPPVPPEVFPEPLAEALADSSSPDAGGSGADEDADGAISVDEANREQLEAAVAAEDPPLDVTGTGSGGYVTTEDMKSALKAAGVTTVTEA